MVLLVCLQVVETTNQVGRLSVSTAHDMPYKEMAGHCEALRKVKQQKLSTFMGQQRPDNLITYSSHDSNQEKEIVSSSIVQPGFPTVLPSSDIEFKILICYFLLLFISLRSLRYSI